MARALIRTVVGIATFLLSGFVAYIGRIFLHNSPVYSLLQVAVPLVATAWIIRRLNRQWGLPVASLRLQGRALPVSILAIGYVATATVGIPACQNHQVAWAISQRDRSDDIDGGAPEDRRGLPRTRTYAAFPVLPGVVLAHHDYSYGPMSGAELWEIYIWYGVGVRSVGRWGLSAS